MNNLSLQHMRLVSGFINGENNPAPGVPLASPSGSIVQPYTGMLGGKMYVDSATALTLSKAATGTLYGGGYQMVKFKEAIVRGQIVFWDIAVSDLLYQVTNVEASVPDAVLIAGIALNSVDAGNYGFIQISGKASVLFKAVLTAAPHIGSRVFESQAGAGADNGTADVLSPGNDPTSFTNVAGMIARYLGIAETAPVGGAISVIDMSPRIMRQ